MQPASEECQDAISGAEGPSMAAVPLSAASPTDALVLNDTVKVVVVGSNAAEKSHLARAIIQGTDDDKLPPDSSELCVRVLTWTPSSSSERQPPAVAFKIWDIHGTDAASHTGTQSLFFSARSLYILVWDMAQDNPKTFLSEDLDTLGNFFAMEQAKQNADLALQADIEDRVLPWVDCVAQLGPGSAFLPVAVLPETEMGDTEVDRRCNMMLELLRKHMEGQASLPELLPGGVSRVRYGDSAQVNQLRRTIHAAVTGGSPVFEHVGAQVPNGTMLVLEAVNRFRRERRMIVEISMLLDALSTQLEPDNLTDVLSFLSSIGEVIYFGSNQNDEHDAILSRYIVLSPLWLVSALSCVVHGSESNMNEAAESLFGSTTSSCPVISSNDVKKLWNCHSFMQEAAQRCSDSGGSSDNGTNMYDFLQRALVRAGILLPLENSSCSSSKLPNVFFVPGCLGEPENHRDIWTFKNMEGWKTTLCHKWPFEGSVPPNVMEQVIVNVLGDLIEFSMSQSHDNSQGEVISAPCGSQELGYIEKVGPVKIDQVMCWKSCITAQIKTVFEYRGSKTPIESTVEVFVALVDESSSHFVSANSSGTSTKGLIVSGRGLVAHQGRSLWRGGYRVVLNAVRAAALRSKKATLRDCRAICTMCLAHSKTRDARAWRLHEVEDIAETDLPKLRCRLGHCIDSRLLCGADDDAESMNTEHSVWPLQAVEQVLKVIPGVVLIVLWNKKARKIFSVASGFIADANLGLVVTAAHLIYIMQEGPQFGAKYIVPIVVGAVQHGQKRAKFRFVANVVAVDVHKVDACVLKIQGRLAQVVDEIGTQRAEQLEMSLAKSPSPMNEQLPSLKMTRDFEMDENVRLIGFPQGGEGVFDPTKLELVDPFVDCARGYICKSFSVGDMIDNCPSKNAFSPREEIVVEKCRSIGGHSGGPCVNYSGEVVGILSRADPDDPRRCYLVPSAELITLMKQAKRHFT